MHTSVKYLVNIPTAARCRYFDVNNREETVRALCSYVEDSTECYRDTVFDWRETEFPENVLFAEDDVNAFVNMLKEDRERKKEEITDLLRTVKERFGTLDLESIAHVLQKQEKGFCGTIYLQELVDGLTDRFTSDSTFFDIENCTVSLSEKSIERVRQNPNEWAVVIFDQHF